MNANNFSKFVLDFINDNKGKDDIIEAWNSTDVQKNFKKLFKKQLEKNDPDRPVKGKTSYLLFCDDHREIVKKNNPGISNTEITIKLAELWNKFKDTNKEKVKDYEQRSLIEREKYKKDKESYIQKKLINLSSEEPKENEKPTKKKRESKPLKEEVKVNKEEVEQVKVNKEEIKQVKVNKEEVKQVEQVKVVKENKVSKKDKFDYFYEKKINKMKRNYPDLDDKQLYKKIYKKWMKLSEEEKNDY